MALKHLAFAMDADQELPYDEHFALIRLADAADEHGNVDSDEVDIHTLLKMDDPQVKAVIDALEAKRYILTGVNFVLIRA